MRRYVCQYRGKGSNPERIVTWNRDVMLTLLLRGQPYVAPRLASTLITKYFQRPRQFDA